MPQAARRSKDNQVAATVNGRNIMLSEVERAVNQQAGGNTSALNQLQMAQARLQVLSSLIQREVLFQRAEREKVLPTEAQIDGAIATQKQNSGMTAEDFEKSLKAQNLSMETLREEARKDLAIAALQDKYSGKIDISDREVEDTTTTTAQQFKSARGVALAMIMVDPADNSATGISDDAKNETDAKLKIDNIYQQLQGKADFATVARAKSEDINTLARGGDIGFATEEDLKNNNFPPELVSSFFGPMQVGDYTQPTRFNSGKWYIFKLAEKRLTDREPDARESGRAPADHSGTDQPAQADPQCSVVGNGDERSKDRQQSGREHAEQSEQPRLASGCGRRDASSTADASADAATRFESGGNKFAGLGEARGVAEAQRSFIRQACVSILALKLSINYRGCCFVFQKFISLTAFRTSCVARRCR